MQIHSGQPGQAMHYAIGAAVVLLVLGVRLFRMRQMRRLRLETLWVVPALYLLFASVMFYEYPPGGPGWLVCAAALVIGGGIGWQRGRLMHIHVDPETHRLDQRASPMAFLLIVALVLVRFAARSLLESGGGYGFHLSAMLVTDVLIALAFGLFAAQRLEMYLRAQRLLAAARAARA